MSFWGPNELVLWSEYGSTTVLGSTHVVQQLSFSMFLSILTFHFGVTFDFFGALMGSFLGFGSGSTPFLGSTHVVEQLSFSLFLSILMFHFDLIFGSLLTFFGALMDYFWVWGWVRHLF